LCHGGVLAGGIEARKRFFLKKAAKTLATLSRTHRPARDSIAKVFGFFFFKKELLFYVRRASTASLSAPSPALMASPAAESNARQANMRGISSR
jgi:hypothetical protein